MLIEFRDFKKNKICISREERVQDPPYWFLFDILIAFLVLSYRDIQL